MASTGMIIDGVLGSQAIDSSGEVLDIEGADISDLEEGRGVLNYEHQSAEDKNEKGEKKNQGQEIVGKIVAAKKIFKESDCDNSRQRTFWRKIKTPFIYGVCRLYDGAGHEGAKALAAQIRDHDANKEPILVRFSVEGSTLDKDENILKRSVIRRVALTLKPCNRTADSGLIEDPNAPAGWDKKPGRSQDLLESIAEDQRKFEHPGFAKLGGVTETLYTPFTTDDRRQLVKAMVKLKLLKAMTAGGGDCAPSGLSGGAALSREHLIGHKTKAMSLFKEYRKQDTFDKAELRAMLKMKMPEASDDFLDHFADLAEDYTVKLRKDEARREQPSLPPPITDTSKPYPEARPELKGMDKPRVDRAAEPPGIVKPHHKGAMEMKDGGKLRVAPIGGKAKVTLVQHMPDDPIYHSLLNPDAALKSGLIDTEQHQHIMRTIHEPWHRAMSHWMPLNNALREGKVPKSIIAKSVVFAAMSPNTSVPMQERYYGHYMDMLHEGLVDPLRPITPSALKNFTERSVGSNMPKWNRDFYVHQDLGVNADGTNLNDEGEQEDKGDLPQIRGMENAHKLFPYLEHLTNKYRDDGQGIAGDLMDMKAEHNRRTLALGIDRRQGRTHIPRPELEHEKISGFGPKLTRYLLGMMGAGNFIVPDRHMCRSSFDLHMEDDKDKLEKLTTQVVTNSKNENLLRAMDHNFFTGHPAVKHVLNTFPKHFQGREKQASFPAFWLHWLTIKHYDQARGRPTMAFNTDTDHMVFWDSVRDEMIKHGLHPHPIDDKYKAKEDSSFDFGHNLEKTEGVDPWPRIQHVNDIPVWMKAAGVLHALTQRWGENAALLAHFSHVMPHIMKAEKDAPAPPVQHAPSPAYHPHLIKLEAMIIDLKKASAPQGDLAAVAPHLHQVQVLRAGPDMLIHSHPAGRFMTAGQHLHILEDYHGHLAQGLSEGPLDQGKMQQIQNLRASNRHQVVPFNQVLAGQHPELLPEPALTQAKPAPSFDYQRLDSETADHLEFRGKIAHLNGHPLNEEQTSALLRHAGNGHAKIRYRQDMGASVRKMEEVFSDLFKTDGDAEGVRQALGRLDELVKAGHLEPGHAQALRQHAFVDPMTGVGNKFAYNDFLTRHAQTGGGVHMVLDGNDFKSVNDKFGHETGDRAIKSFGTAMREAMDETGLKGKLFRVGGDEFAAHLEHHDHAAQFARALRNKLDKMTPIQGTHKLSMAMGIGPTPVHADRALYEAKEQKLHSFDHPLAGQSMYAKGAAPSMAHSLMPGLEGPIPLDDSQLQIKPPPAAPTPEPAAPSPVHTPPQGSAPSGSPAPSLAAKPA